MTYIELEKLTWPEVKNIGTERTLGLIGTGAIEQHGPHLPLSTDRLIATILADRIGASIKEPVACFPVIPGGLSNHHLAFPGTISLDEQTFDGMLTAYVEAFRRIGIREIAIFSSHGGNFSYLKRYEHKINESSPGTTVIAYSDLPRYLDIMFQGARRAGFNPSETDIHAGGVETSQALFAFSNLVRGFEQVRGYATAEDGWLADLFENGIHSLSPTGVLGTVSEANADVGQAIFDELTHELVQWIVTSLHFTEASG